MADQEHHEADVKQLHSMGYAQELSRRMGLFQNFAISFSIICILAGGVTAFPLSLSAAGGASLLSKRAIQFIARTNTFRNVRWRLPMVCYYTQSLVKRSQMM